MTDTSIYKSVVIMLLFITTVLQVHFKELEFSVMKYIWPIHLLVIVLFIIMIFGMEKDRKEIKLFVEAWVGRGSEHKSVKVSLISFTVFLPYFLLSFLPMILLNNLGVFTTSHIQEETGVMSLFIEGWLVFSSTTFFNIFIIHMIYQSLVIPWLTRHSTRPPSSAA